MWPTTPKQGKLTATYYQYKYYVFAIDYTVNNTRIALAFATMDNGRLHNGKRILPRLSNITIGSTTCQHKPTMDVRHLITLGPCGGSHADSYTYYTYYFFIPDELNVHTDEYFDCNKKIELSKCPGFAQVKPFAFTMARSPEDLDAISEDFENELHFGDTFTWRSPDSKD